MTASGPDPVFSYFTPGHGIHAYVCKFYPQEKKTNMPLETGMPCLMGRIGSEVPMVQNEILWLLLTQGNSDLVWTGVAPMPILRVIWAKKVPILGIFLKILEIDEGKWTILFS